MAEIVALLTTLFGEEANLLSNRYWAGGLGFHFRAGKIGHSVANRSSPPGLFFRAVLSRRIAALTSPATRDTHRRNAASIRKS